MKFNVDSTTFGSVSNFDTFNLNIIERNRFIEPPEFLKLKPNQIPVDGGFSNSNPTAVRLSRYFTDFNLMKFPVNPAETSESSNVTKVDGELISTSKIRNHYKNKLLYNNLQRLCLEVLDPVVDLTGIKPNIEHGLIFASTTKNINQDSFFADQVKGNAVVFNFPDQKDDKLIKKVFLYILEYSIFDRLIFDNTLKNYPVPTIKVSVNENRRKLLLRVRT